MTKEEKILKRKQKKHKRIGKKKDELKKILNEVYWSDLSFRQARSKVRCNGTMFICDMRYEECERRGFCNGDC